MKSASVSRPRVLPEWGAHGLRGSKVVCWGLLLLWMCFLLGVTTACGRKGPPKPLYKQSPAERAS